MDVIIPDPPLQSDGRRAGGKVFDVPPFDFVRFFHEPGGDPENHHLCLWLTFCSCWQFRVEAQFSRVHTGMMTVHDIVSRQPAWEREATMVEITVA